MLVSVSALGDDAAQDRTVGNCCSRVGNRGEECVDDRRRVEGSLGKIARSVVESPAKRVVVAGTSQGAVGGTDGYAVVACRVDCSLFVFGVVGFRSHSHDFAVLVEVDTKPAVDGLAAEGLVPFWRVADGLFRGDVVVFEEATGGDLWWIAALQREDVGLVVFCFEWDECDLVVAFVVREDDSDFVLEVLFGNGCVRCEMAIFTDRDELAPVEPTMNCLLSAVLTGSNPALAAIAESSMPKITKVYG